LKFLLCDLLGPVSPDFDVINEIVPNIGYHREALPLLPGGGRLIRSHEPYRPEYRKAVYLVRDPRDIVLSEHRYHKRIGLFDGGLDAFIDDFVNGRVHGFGSWRDHVISWLDSPLQVGEQLAVVRYERLRERPVDTVDEIMTLLGSPTPRERLEQAVQNNSIERMRRKEDESARMQRARRPEHRFVGDGSVRGWRRRLTPEQAAVLDEFSRPVSARLGYGKAPGAGGTMRVSPARSKP
jgi:hypothetical protein